MGHDGVPLRLFVCATVVLAAFFGSVALALGWLG